MWAPRWRSLLVCALLLAGCGSSSPRPKAANPQSAPPVDATPTSSQKRTRSVGRDASFQELVRLAQRLDEHDAGASNAGCLLEREAQGGFAFHADVQVAVRPLPSPPDRVAETLQSSEGFRVLTPWGSLGTPQARVAVATFTPLPPTAMSKEPLLLLGTVEGWLLDGAATDADAPRGAMPPGRLVARLAARSASPQPMLVVTAEADVSLATVYDMLARIPDAMESVALATVLPPGTRLPGADATPAQTASLPHCEDGLPPLPLDARLGDLDAHRVLDSVESLQPAVRACLTKARGSDAAGTRLHIALRVDPSGGVSDACIRSMEPAAPGLARCVLQEALELKMPTPRPEGYIDIELPLDIHPAVTTPPAPICR